MGLNEYLEKKGLAIGDTEIKHMESFVSKITEGGKIINWERVIGTEEANDFDKYIDTSLRLIVNPGLEIDEDIKNIIIDGCKDSVKFNLFLCTMDKIKKAFDDIKEASEEKFLEFMDIYRAALSQEIDINDIGLYLVGRKAFDKENSSVFAGSEIRKAFNDFLLNRLNTTLKKTGDEEFVKADLNDIVLDCHLRNLRNIINNNTAIKNLKEQDPEEYEKLVSGLIVTNKVSSDEYEKYVAILNSIRIPNMEKVLKLYMSNLSSSRNKLTAHMNKHIVEYFKKSPDYIRTHFKLKFFIMSNTFDENSEEGLKEVSDNIAISTSENPKAAAMFSIYNYIFYVLRDSFGVYCYTDYNGATFAPEKILDTGSKYTGAIDVLERYVAFLKEAVFADDDIVSIADSKDIILGYYYRDLYRYFSYNPEISKMFKVLDKLDEDDYKMLLDEVESDANTITNIDLYEYVKEDVDELSHELSDYFFSVKITGNVDVEPQPSPEFNMMGGEITTIESMIDNCNNIIADNSGYRTTAEKDEQRKLKAEHELRLKEVLKRRDEIKLKDRGAYDAECLRQVAVFNNYKDENIKNLYMMVKNPIALREEIIAKQKAEEAEAKKKKKKKKK